MTRIVALLSIFVIAACSGVRSASVVPVQAKDKQLTCRELLLEVNEAEQYKIAAEKNKDPGLRSFFAPLGYMYTQTSADEAITASQERIRYLQEVYQLSGCTAGGAPMQSLNPEQMRGHTFGGGYPTANPGH